MGTWRALLCGKALVRALDEAATVFGRMDDLESSTCKRGTGESFTPYILRSIAVSLRPGCFETVMLLRTAQGHPSNGVNGCRERHGARSLMAGNSTERLVAIWSREDPRFPGHCQHDQPNPSFNVYNKFGIMLILKGWYSSCTAVLLQ